VVFVDTSARLPLFLFPLLLLRFVPPIDADSLPLSELDDEDLLNTGRLSSAPFTDDRMVDMASTERGDSEEGTKEGRYFNINELFFV